MGIWSMVSKDAKRIHNNMRTIGKNNSKENIKRKDKELKTKDLNIYRNEIMSYCFQDYLHFILRK